MSLSRREFLFRAASASGAAAAAGALSGCMPDLAPAPFVDAPAPVDGKIALPLAAHPDLAREGGAVIVRSPGAPWILVAHVPGGGFAATGALCTHQGCPVGVDGGEIVCPCHLSRFAFDGTVRHPPARAGLQTYGASFDGATVTVDLRAGDAGFPILEGGLVQLPFEQFPQLAAPGGSVVGKPQGYGRPILVAALPDAADPAQVGGYAALDAVCTHQQCTVGWDAGAREIACPCHGSRFAADGTAVVGPATLPLSTFAVTADAAGVSVAIPAPP
jgi:Rieske Fe-S protein